MALVSYGLNRMVSILDVPFLLFGIYCLGYGYMTGYYDCEPLYDLETFNKFIRQGLIWGIFYLAAFIYFLRETIKIFKQK
jgi:hypothetical protein